MISFVIIRLNLGLVAAGGLDDCSAPVSTLIGAGSAHAQCTEFLPSVDDLLSNIRFFRKAQKFTEPRLRDDGKTIDGTLALVFFDVEVVAVHFEDVAIPVESVAADSETLLAFQRPA